MRSIVRPLLAVLCLATVAFAADEPAQKPDQPKKEEWNGYEIRKFQVEGREGLLVGPKTPAPGGWPARAASR
jgi:hypothetical protein